MAEGLRIPNALIDATRTGAIVPLIGAGVSQASGMPSWGEIVDVLRRRLATEGEVLDFDTYETPDAVRLGGPYGDLNAILDEAFGSSYGPNELHEILSDIPFRTCLTTNWDILIESSLSKHRRVNVIADDDSARGWREFQATQVIKFHGSLHLPSSIVFGLRDYARLYQQPSIMMSLVRTLLATRPVLSLGFGMKDVFLKSLFHSVERIDARDHFIVVSTDWVQNARTDYFESIGFTPIFVNPVEGDSYGLTAFLEELRAATRLEARSRVDRTALLIRETERLSFYLGPDRTLRVRASLGPFAVPPTNDLNVFGSAEVYETEARLRDTVLEFLKDRRAHMRMIVNPLDGAYALTKGYSEDAHRARLRAFIGYIRDLGPKIELAVSPRATDINDWIAADRALVESRKSTTTDGRLYEYGRVDLNPNVISGAIRRFDEEFGALCGSVGGVEESKLRYVAAGEAIT